MRYRVETVEIKDGDASWEHVLAHAQKNKIRPLCLCGPQGIEMYIAKVSGRHVIKRMPNTGRQHSPACESYEPPPELSGLGQVMGTAIQEDPEEGGLTAIKLDFSLSKVAGRAKPVAGGSETDSVKTDGNKLSLRGVLHYLWEEAGFNRWSPAMSGKRSWYVIRKHLIQASENKVTKGSALGDLLYIPESFSPDKAQEITQRRVARMSAAAASHKGTRRLMIVVGEVKELSPSRYGYKVVFKHLPDCHFMMNEDLHKRLLRRFEVEIGLWDAVENSHLMAIGTFGVSAAGIPSLEEVALMVVTENWIPFESTFDKLVIDAMTLASRRFMRGLRYNLASSKPLAVLVASDTVPATAMYIVPPGATEEYQESLDTLMQESQLGQWLWSAGEKDMPELPPLS